MPVMSSAPAAGLWLCRPKTMVLVAEPGELLGEEEACPGPGLQLAAREGQANPKLGKAHPVSSVPFKGLLNLCHQLCVLPPLQVLPLVKYRKVETPEGPMRVPEGRCCLPCFNVFRCLGRAGVSSVSGDLSF